MKRSGARRRETGAALPAALFVLLLLEAAVLAASGQILRSSFAAQVELGRAAATQLAEAGLAHAAAKLETAPGFRGALDGQLAQGSYRVSVAGEPADVVVTSQGDTPSGRAFRIVERWRLGDGAIEVEARTGRYLLLRRPPPGP